MKLGTKFTSWLSRTFTLAGADAAYREHYLKRHGKPYPGHLPPHPMPAPAVAISLVDRAARFKRGLEVIDSLSPACIRMLVGDAAVLALDGMRKSEPPARRPPHHTMFIVAGEAIEAGRVIQLDSCADGSYFARPRKLPA